jgi:cytochrome b subunit of formate dehydrogenase/nitrate/TMAO reductase-like tetraheme cytochrome c subunit
MRPIPLILGAFLATAAHAAEAPAAPAANAPSISNENKACLECHEASKPGEAGVRPAAFVKSVHADLSCTDCHQSYTAPGPHELPAPTDPKEAALFAKIAGAKTPAGVAKSSAPRAFLACGNCHADAMDQLKGSVHGKWLVEDAPVAGPTCASCHGSPHEVVKIAARTVNPATKEIAPRDPASDKLARERARRCEACHEDPALTKLANLKHEVPLSFRDSIHGRQVAIGSARAPDCTDCHGSHAIVPKTDAASPVAMANRVNTCGKCHSGSNPNFAALISHEPLQETGIVAHIAHVMFSYLTTLTLLFFAFHVLVDLIYELRKRFAKKHGAHDPDDFKTVVRFDIHQRIQHWFMLSGVILLALTGWPLRGAGAPEAIESSRRFLALFGGAHGAGIAHRIGAVLIIISSVYHLVYLATLAKKRALPLSMVPMPKDALDIRDNLLFMLGLSKNRPKFERFNYLEKFDYWAVFWGIVMMVGTGFIFWYPAWFGRFLPTQILATAQIVHGEEATLATIFLFVVHFYNVHLKPSIFPMNWAWLNGRTTIEYMKDEHPLEFEKTFKKKP